MQRLQRVAQSVDEVTRENKELCRRLSDQGAPHKSGDEDLRVGPEYKKEDVTPLTCRMLDL